MTVPTDLGVDIPLWMVVMVFAAAAVAHGSGDVSARARFDPEEVGGDPGAGMTDGSAHLGDAVRFTSSTSGAVG